MSTPSQTIKDYGAIIEAARSSFIDAGVLRSTNIEVRWWASQDPLTNFIQIVGRYRLNGEDQEFRHGINAFDFRYSEDEKRREIVREVCESFTDHLAQRLLKGLTPQFLEAVRLK